MTPKNRQAHLAHIHARDKIYDANRRESRRLSDRSRYFRERDARRKQKRDYYIKNREKTLRRFSMRLCAEDMIAEALS